MAKILYRPNTDLTDRVLPGQSQNPETLEFLSTPASNRRAHVDGNGALYFSGDETVHARGTKAILWSSEGFTREGVTYPALTAAQKRATGSSALTFAGSVVPAANVSGTLPQGFTLPTSVDTSLYNSLTLVITVLTLTGTSIQFELDALDDVSPTPNSVALVKPTALTAPGSLYISMSSNAGTAPSLTSPAVAVNVSVNVPAQAQIAWTATALTACTWNAFLYGNH